LYHTLLERLPFPQRGVGSPVAVVAALTEAVLPYGSETTVIAALQESLLTPELVRVAVGVGERVMVGLAVAADGWNAT